MTQTDLLTTQVQLDRHVAALLRCHKCPRMHKPVVSGGAVVSRVMLVGQAPGDKEPVLETSFCLDGGKEAFSLVQRAHGSR